MVSRKARICLRFYDHELAELDELVRSSGCTSRTRLVNIMVERFLNSSVLTEFGTWRKRQVKFLLDAPVHQRLMETAKRSGVRPAAIVRLALQYFMEGQANRRNPQPANS